MKIERLLALENHPETRVRINRLRRRSAREPSGERLPQTQDAAREALRTALAEGGSSSAPYKGLPRFRVRKLPVLATVLLVVVGAAAVLTTGYSVARSLGVEWLQAGGDNTVVAIVGDETITRSTIEQSKINEKFAALTATQTGNGDSYVPLTGTALLERIIEDKIVYQEAVRQGFTVSDEFIDQVVTTQETTMKEHLDDPDVSGFVEYIGGMGYSLDEYWQLLRPWLRRVFVASQLEKKILDGVTGYSERTAAWNKYKTDLVRQHQSEIHIIVENIPTGDLEDVR